jgi:hypothetical protein
VDRSRPSYSIELYSATYKVEGLYQPLGALFSAINDPDRSAFYLSDAVLTPLRPRSPLRPARMPEAGFGKRDVNLVCFQDENVVEELHLLRRAERVIVYTPAFVLRGNMHLGAEQLTRDMLDLARGRFQPMTDVTLFALLETNVPIPQKCGILLVNTDLVQVYCPDAGPTRGAA